MASMADEAGRPYRLLCYMYFFLGRCQREPRGLLPGSAFPACSRNRDAAQALRHCAGEGAALAYPPVRGP